MKREATPRRRPFLPGRGSQLIITISGCYNAVLGNLDEAARHLETSFQMDKKFREIAKFDPDLKAVHGLLGK